MNNVNLIGRLTKDVEVRHTNSGKAVCSFCVAVDGGKNVAYFIDCVAWEARAENISKYFKKGNKIGIAGMLTTRDYEDSNGNKRKVTEVLVNSFDFCAENKTATAEAPAAVTEVPAVAEETAEALPFEI